jgi:nucleoside 2-deoxyribosyltransferase
MLGKVYFASPFFKESQIEREERCKAKLRELGFNVFSPKEAFVVTPNQDAETRKAVFNMNITNIRDADVIFVVTDERDIGTIWESGCAYGLNVNSDKKIKVVYYCETLPPNMPFNLMLAQSGDVIITEFSDLDNLPEYLDSGKDYTGIVQ